MKSLRKPEMGGGFRAKLREKETRAEIKVCLGIVESRLVVRDYAKGLAWSSAADGAGRTTEGRGYG